MKTAVEWLGNEINRRGPKEDNPPQWLKELYEQANKMFEEQIKDSWKDGKYCDTIYNEFNYEDAEQYYKETFKSE